MLESAGADSVTDQQRAPSGSSSDLLVGFSSREPFSNQFANVLADLAQESGLSQDPLADTDPIQ